MTETEYLLSTPANAAHLAKSIAQHKAGKVIRLADLLTMQRDAPLTIDQAWDAMPSVGLEALPD